MSDEHSLRKLLARVHERLNSSANVDPGKRASLQKVMQDIDQRLQARQGESTSAHVPRLEALAVQFEAEHPALAQLLRQLGALLGQAGI
ncbi:MAG: DUF4404 family protein [Sinobacteraceae bacterium]|nr:DUF4404 family protein [Nevskiaceae bacterium]